MSGGAVWTGALQPANILLRSDGPVPLEPSEEALQPSICDRSQPQHKTNELLSFSAGLQEVEGGKRGNWIGAHQAGPQQKILP